MTGGQRSVGQTKSYRSTILMPVPVTARRCIRYAGSWSCRSRLNVQALSFFRFLSTPASTFRPGCGLFASTMTSLPAASTARHEARTPSIIAAVVALPVASAATAPLCEVNTRAGRSAASCANRSRFHSSQDGYGSSPDTVRAAVGAPEHLGPVRTLETHARAVRHVRAERIRRDEVVALRHLLGEGGQRARRQHRGARRRLPGADRRTVGGGPAARRGERAEQGDHQAGGDAHQGQVAAQTERQAGRAGDGVRVRMGFSTSR